MAGAFVPNPESGPVGDLIEDLAAALAAQYAVIEQQLIEMVAAYGRAAIDTPPDVNARLLAIRDLKERALALMDGIDVPATAAQVLAIADSEGRAAAIRRLGLVDLVNTGSALSSTSAAALGAMTVDLTNELGSMRTRILRWAPDAYQRVIAIAAGPVLTGVDTLRTAERRAIERFLGAGISGFTDKGGRNWRIGSYAEMATRTAVHRAWMDGNIDRLAQDELHLVQIIIGVDACQACAAVAGKVWSTDGTPAGTITAQSLTDGTPVTITVAGTLDEARARGWSHPNCRCVVAGVLPGIALTSNDSTYDPEREKARDRLRYLERAERDAKRRAAAAMDDVEQARWNRRVRARQQQIRDHVEQTGVKRKPYRESLSFSDGRRTSTPRPRPRAIR